MQVNRVRACVCERHFSEIFRQRGGFMAYKNVNYGKKAVRRNYSKIRTEVELPDLLEIQTSSFQKFVTEDLSELFKDISPISNESGTLNLYFGEHYFEQPKYDIVQSKLRDTNYSRSLKVKVLLKVNYKNEQGEDQEELIEKEIFMGDFPFMTPAGTFIINGAERVIISQIIRSSGIYYSKELDKKTGLTRFSGQMIPTRGAWIEFETGSKDIWYAKFDRSKKIPVTTFIRSMGIAKNKDIYDLFGKSTFLEAAMEREAKDIADRKRNYLEKNKNNKDRVKQIEKYTDYDWSLIDMYVKLRQEEDVPPENAREHLISHLFDDRRYDLQTVGRYKYNKKLDVLERAKGLKLAENIKIDKFDSDTGEIIGEEIIARAGEKITEEVCEVLRNNREAFRKPLPVTPDMLEAMEKYFDSEVYITEQATTPMCEILKVYNKDGGRESKMTIIGNDQREEALHVTLSDIFAATSYYFNLYDGIGSLDDIDHLGNRRLRLIGELLKNQFRAGLLKVEKSIKERMSTNFVKDEIDSIVYNMDAVEKTKKLQGLINIKPLTSVLKEFFGSSQLSQFMDQINPLAEITQKRRISALGSGGIARDRAGVEVRDVHYTHYGRMCPIETPEGPSIGLITSLATYAKVNELGFIESPYYKFTRDEEGRKVVTDQIDYLTANDEDSLVIAAANTTLDSEGHIIDKKVIGRKHGETEFVDPNEVDYMDISPKQIISVATSTIPFLEHDDAVRALMGANMQRQAVPIINPESPIVGTGIEHKAAHDCGSAIVAAKGGVVEYVDAKKIVIREEDGTLNTYYTYQFLRSNQDTAILQKPIVRVGEVVEAGDIIADGQSMQNGELALGRNVRIGFMTWDGYNFEDAVIMNEKMVKEDIYTSIHIDQYEIETRDTKLGKEEITREIPNVSQDALKFLDAKGIIIPGAEVKEGDILVGKVTPKGQTDPTPEERLLLSIFGEKTRDVRDSSLRVKHGSGGVVHSVQYYSKANGDELPPGVMEVVRIYIVKKRKIREGDKMAGRHGNKGVISRIVPSEDMPFDKYGRPLDIMLNPQGVPSRMNIGQVLEIHLGMAAQRLGIKVATPVFDGVTMEELQDIMKESGMHVDEMLEKGLDPNDPEAVANYKCDGKQVLYDGRTGEAFENRISVGVMYFVKLSHMVDDKLHARSVGPYTLITQQPMGGKAQNGGQRFGEMEVWALEAYGAAHTLREMLTVKSDDILGRNKVFRAITNGEPIPPSSIPESFRVLTRELQALGLHIELINNAGENEANKSLVDPESDYISKYGF